MKINGEELKTLAVFPTMMTVPDCFVKGSNKLGEGHGEKKFYIGSKEQMYDFYGDEGFEAKCFLLKKDLISYMYAIRNEYFSPSLDYHKKDDFPKLWHKHMDKIFKLDDVLFFTLEDQGQIDGSRGYVKSKDAAYKIIREIALPLVSYIYVEKVGTENAPLFYWKLFVDFTAVNEIQNGPLVFKYGKKKDFQDKKKQKKREKTFIKARKGQEKYRDELLQQCPFCPFTMITDERLLIASHIKPWAAADDDEKVDPYNGYMLSPLYDKLFDRGFITFTYDKHVVLSKFISPRTWKQIKLADNDLIEMLLMDDKRYEYLKFHHDNVFKGTFDFKD